VGGAKKEGKGIFKNMLEIPGINPFNEKKIVFN